LRTITFRKLREEEKENRKSLILDITEALLLENGIDEVTIRNVSEKAGLSTGALYLYFNNKEELLASLLIRKLRLLNAEMVSLADTKNKPAELFRSIALTYGSYFIKYGRYIDLFRYITEKRQADMVISRELMDELITTMASNFKSIEQMISGGKLMKNLKKIPPQRVVPVLWGIVLGISQITLSSTRGETAGFEFEQVIGDCIRVLS